MKEPQFIVSNLHLDEVEDESDYLQIGQFYEESIFHYTFGFPAASSWIYFPHKYKFISLELFFHFDKITFSREPYSLLEYFGDIGGLLDFLFLIGMALIAPLTIFKLQATLLEQLFDERNYDNEEHQNLS